MEETLSSFADDTHSTPSNTKPQHVLILLPLGLSLCLLTIIIFKRRLKRDVSVNCWFCNHNFKVPRGNENCFDCPSCEQYNGFKENGDYNKPIPAQYNEDMNYPVTGGPPKHSSSTQIWTNRLCSPCNYNQAVKIKLISSFEPVLQSNEDEELPAYIAHLENLYRLCWRCQVQVRTTLEQQDAQLVSLLPTPSTEPFGSSAETPEIMKRLKKCIHCLVVLGEFTCLSFSLCMLWRDSRPYMSSIYHHPSFQQVFNALLPPSEFSVNEPILYGTGLLITATTSVLDRAEKGLRSIFTRLSLWFLFLIWSMPSYMSWTPSFPDTIFSGDKICVEFLLTVTCFTSLLKSFTARSKQPRIRKRYLKREVKESDGNTQKSSDIADWISSCNKQYNQVQPSSFSVKSNGPRLSPASFLPKCLQLDHAFDQMHISLTKQYKVSPSDAVNCEFAVLRKRQTYGKGFSESGFPRLCHRPLLRPAHFFPKHNFRAGQSISETSWVAGGFWSVPVRTNENIKATFSTPPVTSGLLTPPPSLDGSQASQPGSLFNEGLAASSKSVFDDCGRSWPPSHASLRQQQPPSSSTLSSLGQKGEPVTERNMQYFWLSSLKNGAIFFSILFNLVVITHIVWSRNPSLR